MAGAPRKLAIALIGVASLAALAWVVLSITSANAPSKANAVKDYVARQIVGIVNTYLEPTLDFDTITLDMPGTVRLTGARLISPGGTDILDLDSLVITLTEFPKPGEPLHIASIEINGGAVNLIYDPATGRFQGLDPLIKNTARKTSGKTKGKQVPIPEAFRLSTVFQLKRIILDNIALTYDDGSGMPPMRIEGFRADMVISPTSDGPGWYALDINAGRHPGLTLELEGAFNLDSFEARIARGQCTVVLDENTAASLPPPIQSLVRTMDATGHASVSFTGLITPGDIGTSRIAADISLREFNIAAGQYHLPIEAFDARLDLDNGIAQLTDTTASTMQGRATMTATANLTKTGKPANARWTIQGVQLQEALRASVRSGESPKLAGILSGSGQVSTSLTAPVEKIVGSGQVQVRQGRLLVLPGMGELIQKIGNAAATGGGKFNHRADAEFTVEPAGIQITRSEVVTGVLAARATGSVAWNGMLDLVVNAGPLERLQSALGAVGDLFGKLTDQLVKYRVRGPMANPSVTVAPLGLGG